MNRSVIVTIVFGCIASLGCQKDPMAESKDTKAAATPDVEKVTLKAQPKPLPEKAAEPVKKPAVALSEWQLSDSRRATIEKAIDGAEGFLDASEFAEKLKDINDEPSAVKAIDEVAKGKWILIVAPIEAVNNEGVKLPLFAPLEDEPAPSAKKGFTIQVSNIAGFKPDAYKPGSRAVILAQYQGNQLAAPAHDLLALGHWATPGEAQEAAAEGEEAAPAKAGGEAAEPEESAGAPKADEPAAAPKPAE